MPRCEHAGYPRRALAPPVGAGALSAALLLLLLAGPGAMVPRAAAVKEASMEDVEAALAKGKLYDHNTAMSFPKSVTQYPSWFPLHRTYVNEAELWKARGGLDLLFLGDSLTETWRGTQEMGKRPCIRCNGVEDIFAKHYGHLKATAFGIARDQAPNLLWRIQNGELPEALNAKVVVVMVGSFDVAAQPLRTWQQTRDAIKAIVSRIRTTLPETHVVPMAILPRNRIIHVEQAKTNPIRANITLVNKALKKEATAGGSWAGDPYVHFLDCTGDFLDGHKAYVVRYLMPDFVHLSDAGHEKWAQCLKPVLASLLPFPDDAPAADAAAAAAANLNADTAASAAGSGAPAEHDEL